MNCSRLLVLAGLCLAQVGCETISGGPLTKGEKYMEQVNVEGLKIGDDKKVMARFPKAMKQPFGRTDREVYEIPNPNYQISLAIAYFVNDKLEKLELRYFDGPGVGTLRATGGWEGLRSYLMERFGAPSRVGPTVPLDTELGDLNPKYAKFNAAWDFPRLHRRVHYIAFTDPKGGVAAVTFVNTTPEITPQTNAWVAGGPQTAPTSPAPKVGQTAAVVVPSGPPNPGF